MTDAHIQTERIDDVLLITMDDGKANALSFSAIEQIAAALARAEADESIVAVVLAGSEGRFSGGFDLSVMQAGDFEQIVTMVADGGDLVRQLFGCSVPVVAACTGHAVAAGALLLLGCDVRVGPDTPAKIGFNEVAIGMVLPAWAFTIAEQRLSPRHIQRAVVNATMYDGPGAVEAGFLDFAVAPDQVIPVAIGKAAALAALNRPAYVGTVERFRGPTLATMAQQIAADRAAVL